MWAAKLHLQGTWLSTSPRSWLLLPPSQLKTQVRTIFRSPVCLRCSPFPSLSPRSIPLFLLTRRTSEVACLCLASLGFSVPPSPQLSPRAPPMLPDRYNLHMCSSLICEDELVQDGPAEYGHARYFCYTPPASLTHTLHPSPSFFRVTISWLLASLAHRHIGHSRGKLRSRRQHERRDGGASGALGEPVVHRLLYVEAATRNWTLVIFLPLFFPIFFRLDAFLS